jgi:hypothetical protein
LSELAIKTASVPAIGGEALEKIAHVEAKIRQMPQIDPPMEHVLHGGMYARTCRLNAGVAIVSVLIKIPTVIVVHGRARVYAGDGWFDVDGFHVIPASAHRKMVYVTLAPTEITMLFPTRARTVEEAEREFTDEHAGLLSNRQDNAVTTITGVEPCQA